MAIKAKIKNPPDKKEPPKREPIVVSDINDPRLNAYRDSLNLSKSNFYIPHGEKIFKNKKEFKSFFKDAIGAVGLVKDNKYVNNTYKYQKGIQPIDYADFEHNPKLFTKPPYTRILYKEPIQPVIFKAKEKEKIEKIEPTAKKVIFEKSQITPKKEPTKTKAQELTYRVEYYDPEKKQMTHQMFASEREGSLFQKGLSSANQLYGTKGYYVKSPSK